MHDEKTEARLRRLEDRADLKALVDTFSILADRKDIRSQVLLFTEDATVDSYVGDQRVSALKGREQLAAAFEGYLSRFETVYHQNGQQTVEIEGGRATGTAYCLTVLVGMQDGRRVMTTSGVTYADRYVRGEAGWLIAGRVTRLEWQRSEELPAAQP
ncbi:nuclear transport factor 2 family protein [Methylobacterium currus]|uniref:Nuclear transport factor 2 family protein n=2 Tax=Methylobacterium TaxID=407 RepID=A0A2R4WTT0_9HYPH|nr:nuclear transport factor 2 family protein [Methylobacterium currus]MBK3397136.1 nuclear transport factor 2 family protein [Methylobacterium ajmalii]MBK3408351.1 nuclear transport factor 2 family protein [Methylobacterium ajmalii]MBK3421167.1 nuclear transport factor 2 family protein [Methylobacterium ajmalii]